MTLTIEQIDAELDQLSREAKRRYDEQLDSSDCALSRWADGITSSKLQLQRELILNGGMAAFLAITDLEGNPVPAKMIVTKFRKTCWALLDANGKINGTFLPVCDDDCETGAAYVAKDAKLQKRGYRQVVVLRRAEVRIVGSGTGLSGSAWASVIDPVTGQGSCAYAPSVPR